MKSKILFTALFFGFVSVLFIACQSTGGSTRNDAAGKAFNRAEKFYNENAFEKAIAEYTKAIELDPKYAEAFIGRANARVWNNDFDFVQADFDTAAAIDSQYQDYAQGYRCNSEHNYGKAIELFTEVIQKKINLMDAYGHRGFSYLGIGEFEKAIADYTEAVKINTNFYSYYSNRAFCYYRIRQFDKALSDVSKAIELSHDASTWLFNLRSVIYISLKKYDEAISDYSQAINSSPNDGIIFTNRGCAYLYRAKANAQMSDLDKALADADAALQIDPSNKNAQELKDEVNKFLLAQQQLAVTIMPEALWDLKNAVDLKKFINKQLGKEGVFTSKNYAEGLILTINGYPDANAEASFRLFDGEDLLEWSVYYDLDKLYIIDKPKVLLETRNLFAKEHGKESSFSDGKYKWEYQTSPRRGSLGAFTDTRCLELYLYGNILTIKNYLGKSYRPITKE